MVGNRIHPFSARCPTPERRSPVPSATGNRDSLNGGPRRGWSDSQQHVHPEKTTPSYSIPVQFFVEAATGHSSDAVWCSASLCVGRAASRRISAELSELTRSSAIRPLVQPFTSCPREIFFPIVTTILFPLSRICWHLIIPFFIFPFCSVEMMIRW